MTKLVSDFLNSHPCEGRGEASAWYDKVIIPTYGIGKPEKNPMFLEKRVYQGGYPHPVIEKILNEKVDKKWKAVQEIIGTGKYKLLH
jgi:hypothetical protein